MHARIARYGFSGDAHDLARRAEGMLPIFQSQTGFKAYSLIESDGEILSFSAWDSAEQAEAASAAAAQWIADNIADQIEELEETRFDEILLSTPLGVTATAGVA